MTFQSRYRMTFQPYNCDYPNRKESPAKSLKRYLCDLYLKPKMEVYLRQSLIRPIRVQDLMHERRKYILPDKKFRSSAKTKVAELKEKRKKLDQKLKKAKGSVSFPHES